MKDALGNELHVGDMVALQLERPLIFGRIAEAVEGGLVTGINRKGGTDVHPGRLMIASSYPIEFDPRMPIRAVIAVREDDADAKVTVMPGRDKDVEGELSN